MTVTITYYPHYYLENSKCDFLIFFHRIFLYFPSPRSPRRPMPRGPWSILVSVLTAEPCHQGVDSLLFLNCCRVHTCRLVIGVVPVLQLQSPGHACLTSTSTPSLHWSLRSSNPEQTFLKNLDSELLNYDSFHFQLPSSYSCPALRAPPVHCPRSLPCIV